MENKKLYKVSDNAQVTGVCQGISEYLNMDVSIVRILTALAVIFTGAGLIVYIVLAIVLPDKKDVIQKQEEEEIYTDEYAYNEDEYRI